jgi:hypothetical protein
LLAKELVPLMLVQMNQLQEEFRSFKIEKLALKAQTSLEDKSRELPVLGLSLEKLGYF